MFLEIYIKNKLTKRWLVWRNSSGAVISLLLCLALELGYNVMLLWLATATQDRLLGKRTFLIQGRINPLGTFYAMRQRGARL